MYSGEGGPATGCRHAALTGNVHETILQNEPIIRGAFFAGVLVLLVGWEMLAPRRATRLSRRVRWPGNLGIAALDTLIVRLAFPTLAVAFAITADEHGWGLLNELALPVWVTLPVAVLLLDLAIYLQHVLFHAVPAFWRLHRMHHADLELDVTTGVRFHPAEMLLSMVIKLAVIAALGPPALAVLVFEVLLSATSLFNHGNVLISPRIDRVLRWIVVTPDMHRVHHSTEPDETNSNFGFNLPWWDRLFGTYRGQPRQGHANMTLGLAQFRDPRDLRLDRMLIQPLIGDAGRLPQVAKKTTISASSTRSPP